MERVEINATKRNEGKGGSKKLRNEGMIPGVLYGKGYKNVNLAVNAKELEKAVSTHAGMNILVDLAIDGGEKTVSRICDYQAHQISRKFTHIDFQTVDLSKKITIEVPLEFGGKSKGVKEGGVLVVSRRKLEIKCLPTNIPESIVIDISELDIGDGLHINDVKLPEGAECAHDINFSIVSVVAPTKEEEVVPVVAVEGVEGAVPAEGVAGAVPAAGAAGAVPGAKPVAGAAPAAGVKPAQGAKPAGGDKKSEQKK